MAKKPSFAITLSVKTQYNGSSHILCSSEQSIVFHFLDVFSTRLDMTQQQVHCNSMTRHMVLNATFTLVSTIWLQFCDLWPQCWQSYQNCFLPNTKTHPAAA